MVISVEKQAVDDAADRLLEAGASRAVPLRVDGPFHSPMLEGAGKKLRALLDDVTVRVPEIPYISNVTAQEENEPSHMKELLGRQVYSPVRWQQSMEYMIRAGVDTFVEIGPGKTLSNFAKKIDRNLRVYHVETVEDLKNYEK
jgi:[acyl-carrier-protein] S-malonyltransferase